MPDRQEQYIALPDGKVVDPSTRRDPMSAIPGQLRRDFPKAIPEGAVWMTRDADGGFQFYDGERRRLLDINHSLVLTSLIAQQHRKYDDLLRFIVETTDHRRRADPEAPLEPSNLRIGRTYGILRDNAIDPGWTYQGQEAHPGGHGPAYAFTKHVQGKGFGTKHLLPERIAELVRPDPNA